MLFALLNGIDLLNTGFVVTDTLASASARPTHPDSGWLILWQNRSQDLRENCYPVSKINIARIKEVDIITEIHECLVRYGIAENFEISNNVLEHPRVWRMWSEAFKQYEMTINAKKLLT